MLRVFLVIDDYNELIYLQTLLKKLGFDVESLQNQKKYPDLSLGFNPHILITTAKGRKVDGLALASSIVKKRNLPKIIALCTHEQLDSKKLIENGVDVGIETPVNPKSLIVALAQQGGVDETALLEKYAKIKGHIQSEGEKHMILSTDESGQPVEHVRSVKETIEELTGVPADSPETNEQNIEIQSADTNDARAKISEGYSIQSSPDSERMKRFAKAEKELGPISKKNFDRDRIKEFNKLIRAWPQPDDISEIEDERKKFVESLFKKN